MRRKAKAPKVNPTAYFAVLVLAPILSCVSFHSLTQTKENNIWCCCSCNISAKIGNFSLTVERQFSEKIETNYWKIDHMKFSLTMRFRSNFRIRRCHKHSICSIFHFDCKTSGNSTIVVEIPL